MANWVTLVENPDCCCTTPVQFDCFNTAVRLTVSGWTSVGCTDCQKLNREWCLLPPDAQGLDSGCDVADLLTLGCDYSCGYQRYFNMCGDQWSWNLIVCGEIGVGFSAQLVLTDSNGKLGQNYWAWGTDPIIREGNVSGLIEDFDYTFIIDNLCAIQSVDNCQDFNAQMIAEVVPIEQCGVAGFAMALWPFRFGLGA